MAPPRTAHARAPTAGSGTSAADRAAHVEAGAHVPRAYASLAILLVLSVAFSMCMAPTAQFVLRLVCREEAARRQGVLLSSDADGPPMEFCQQPDVQGAISKQSALLGLANSIPSLLLMPLYGKLSDSIGRKPFLYAPVIAEVFNLAVLLTAHHFALPSATIAIGFLAMGLSGGFSTFLMAFFASVADAVPTARRTYFFTLVEGSLFAGMGLGPLIMSVLTQFGSTAPFYVAGGLFILTLLLVHTLIDGAGHPAKSPSVNMDEADTASYVPPSGGLWCLVRPWNRTRMVLIASFFLSELALNSHISIFVPYTYRKFNWTAKMDGLFMSLGSATKLIAILAFLPLVRRHKKAHSSEDPVLDDEAVANPMPTESDPLILPEPVNESEAQTQPSATPGGASDLWIIRAAMASYTLAFLVYAFATTGSQYMWGAPLGATGILCMPALRSLISQTLPRVHQGAAQASVSMLQSLTFTVAPLSGAFVYAKTVGWWDGAVYIVGAGLWCIAIMCTFAARSHELIPPAE